jgi:rod shape-determining protein MreD
VIALLRTVLIWVVVAVVGELLVAPAITIAGVAPDFPLIALVLLALSAGPLAGSAGGFCIGLIQDLAAPPLLGLGALCKTLIGHTWGRMRSYLLYGMPVVEAAIILIAVIAHDLLYLLGASLLGGAEFLRPLLTRTLPVGLYSALIGLPLLRLARHFGLVAPED